MNSFQPDLSNDFSSTFSMGSMLIILPIVCALFIDKALEFLTIHFDSPGQDLFILLLGERKSLVAMTKISERCNTTKREPSEGEFRRI
jgi:hypothetical protein